MSYKVQKKAINKNEIEDSPVDREEPMMPPIVTGNIPPHLQHMVPGAEKKAPKPKKVEQAMTGSPLQDDTAKLNAVLNKVRSSTAVMHEVSLPSMGKFYNGSDGPTDGVLHLRPMTGVEEQILATPALVRQGRALHRIVENCMQENYSAENFLAEDITFLLIFLRCISYDIMYDIQVTCPFTNRKFPYVVNLNKECGVDYCPNHYGPESLQGTLPVSGLSFSFRLQTARDSRVVDEHNEKHMQQFEVDPNSFEDRHIHKMSMLLREIGGLYSEVEKKIVLKELHIKDINHIKHSMFDVPFGINTKITIASAYVGDEFEVELPIGANFFSPKVKANQ